MRRRRARCQQSGKVAPCTFLAEIIEHGRTMMEPRSCEAIRDREGLRYVHSPNEPDLIAGVAPARYSRFRRLRAAATELATDPAAKVALGTSSIRDCGNSVCSSSRRNRCRRRRSGRARWRVNANAAFGGRGSLSQ